MRTIYITLQWRTHEWCVKGLLTLLTPQNGFLRENVFLQNDIFSSIHIYVISGKSLFVAQPPSGKIKSCACATAVMIFRYSFIILLL